MRRGITRGRVFVAVGAALALAGMILPWITVGGDRVGLPVQTANGFSGAGILIFVAAVGLLVLLVLPYAASTGRSSLDRPIVFALLGGAAVAGMVIQVVQLWSGGGLAPLPLDRAPGLWITGVGVLAVAWGVGELMSEKPSPL